MTAEWTETGLHIPTLERIAAALDGRLSHLAIWAQRNVSPPRVELGAFDGWLAQLEETAGQLRRTPDVHFPPTEVP